MGMLSERMSIEKEQLEQSGVDPETFNANTEEGISGTGGQRASPVSSEDSDAVDQQPPVALASTETMDQARVAATNRDDPTRAALRHAADGIAVLAESVTKHASPSGGKKSAAAKGESDSYGVARGCRSVTREDLDESLAGKAMAREREETKLPSDQSTKSSIQQEGSRQNQDCSEDQSSNTPGIGTNDGPPQFITTQPSLRSKSTGKVRRRGKWTVEEEAYVARVIQDFNSGFLDAPAGTTLRTFLSDKLNCDPMRITKKFTGEACIGKRVFHPAMRNPGNAGAIDKAQTELEELERRWRSRLELQQKESAKKAAASAAAAAAAAANSVHGFSNDTAAGSAVRNPILQTAAWLDRAKSVTSQPSASIEGLPRSEVMSQMAEVQKLLNEGTTMQRTSVDLSHLVDQQPIASTQDNTSGTQSPPPEPADKRLRTGAEDAEALVGFLRSVRASAASGQEF